ncbi:hypothetical protein Lalb_Chr11g0069811 [Lupinus albus]|uniref:Uncharacterized protein n=1 Tax=Lupinus albus TaxID=3870 RepID=A0A6A4PSB0_LUPAL|nr:hypothetical protein Lalb_Chr11g0069811 [Lupinus albus]
MTFGLPSQFYFLKKTCHLLFHILKRCNSSKELAFSHNPLMKTINIKTKLRRRHKVKKMDEF